MLAISCNPPYKSLRASSSAESSCFSRQNKLIYVGLGLGQGSEFKGKELYKWKSFLPNLSLRCRTNSSSCGKTRIVNGYKGEDLSTWEDKPYEVLPGGKRAYFDEQDIVAFLDPPKELIPLDPTSYNAAAYLWKKIEDIPEERRHRLLYLLKPRLISKVWEIAGTRYEDPKLVKKGASSLLSNVNDTRSLEFWNCRTSGGPMLISWINYFKKVIFSGNNGKTYGRLIIGGPFPPGVGKSIGPLYFTVRQLKEVMSTEQPCDLAYEFGDGLLDLHEYPQDFPKPEKHPWPFNDYVVIYVRHVGPGVLVAQAWQEGEALEQVPKKFCSEILMVKDYASAG